MKQTTKTRLCFASFLSLQLVFTFTLQGNGAEPQKGTKELR
jgi:hypothetical protein